MTCHQHSRIAQHDALSTGLCPLCLQVIAQDLLAIIESPEWRRTELAAYLQGYSCPPNTALANATTIARAKETLK